MSTVFMVNASRTCVTCEQMARVKLGGMRCIHPLSLSYDVLFGLPPLCSDARAMGQPCGPEGDLHSSALSATGVRN